MRFLRDLLRTDRYVVTSPHDPTVLTRRARELGAVNRFRGRSSTMWGRASRRRIVLRCYRFMVPSLGPILVAGVAPRSGGGAQLNVSVRPPRPALLFHLVFASAGLLIGVGGLVQTGDFIWLFPAIALPLTEIALAGIDHAGSNADRELLRAMFAQIAGPDGHRRDHGPTAP